MDRRELIKLSKYCQHSIFPKMSQSNINKTRENIPLLSEQTHEEAHSVTGELLKSIIYGGVDGTVNTTIIILSGISSGTPWHSIFAIAIAAVVAGALDMACCDYVSAKAEIAYIQKEEDREHYEVQNYLPEEKQEIIQIYLKKQYEMADCIRLSELYSTNKQAFVNIMMLEELNLVSIKDEAFPMKCGVATLFSFLVFGLVTASPYIVKAIFPGIPDEIWPYVLGICTLELTSLGLTKAIILGINRWKSMGQIVLMGAIATGVGYGVGLLFPS